MTVAIIDTGVAYDFYDTPFLYNARGEFHGELGISGWDFINKDYDPKDDNGHGTSVTKIITDALHLFEVPYQIIPIKSFDQDGKGTYFDIVCGMNYASKIANIDIVNMSFGWYGMRDQSIITTIMKERQDILYVTSAGNSGIDVDNTPEFNHFPSGFELDNVIGVAGYHAESVPSDNVDEITTNISLKFSNYGIKSIDIVAPLNGYELVLQSDHDYLELTPEGTSFSAAFTTARAGKLKSMGFVGTDLKLKMLDEALFVPILLDKTTTGRILMKE